MLLDSIILDVLTTAIWQEKKTRGVEIRKEEIKLLLTADDMIVYVANPPKPTNFSRISEFSKLAINKTNTLKLTALPYANNKIGNPKFRTSYDL